jgi:nucleoside-diphosphate-sugar epimerase
MNSGKETALVIGMNGGFGGATARALEARGLAIRALARRPPQTGAGNIEWIRGDAMNPSEVLAAARGAQVIVHAANPAGYKNWPGLAIPMLENTIATAQRTGATIVFPGNVYNYGPDDGPLFSEDSPQNPLTRKGAIRVEMEGMLLAASRDGLRTIIVRAGDFFGPGGGTASSWFARGLVKPGKPVTKVIYPGAPEVGHAWAYLPDLAETVARLVMRRAEFAPFETFNFGGHSLARGGEMAEAICDVAGIPRARIGAFPWWAIGTLSPFVEMFREMREMRYLWQRDVRLDNRKLVAVLGGEPHTALADAVRESLHALGIVTAEHAVTQPA